MLAFVWFTTLVALQGGIGGVGVGEGGGKWLSGFGSLIRRKQVDSVHYRGHAQLARKLSAVDLVGIGVGATIGAGEYILIGTVAREQAGPTLVISLFIAGIVAALSALCYAELACRCPSAGSAYHYTYICIGEAVAWMVGWSLILEYTFGASAVARGITPNLMMERWYQSAEERMSASTEYPPPPPPAPKGVELELRKLEGSVEAIHEN